ncbi:hypothetical protein HK096_007095, partial [Nowakowskiella sp. JEL0078]
MSQPDYNSEFSYFAKEKNQNNHLYNNEESSHDVTMTPLNYEHHHPLCPNFIKISGIEDQFPILQHSDGKSSKVLNRIDDCEKIQNDENLTPFWALGDDNIEENLKLQQGSQEKNLTKTFQMSIHDTSFLNQSPIRTSKGDSDLNLATNCKILRGSPTKSSTFSLSAQPENSFDFELIGDGSFNFENISETDSPQRKGLRNLERIESKTSDVNDAFTKDLEKVASENFPFIYSGSSESLSMNSYNFSPPPPPISEITSFLSNGKTHELLFNCDCLQCKPSHSTTLLTNISSSSRTLLKSETGIPDSSSYQQKNFTWPYTYLSICEQNFDFCEEKMKNRENEENMSGFINMVALKIARGESLPENIWGGPEELYINIGLMKMEKERVEREKKLFKVDAEGHVNISIRDVLILIAVISWRFGVFADERSQMIEEKQLRDIFQNFDGEPTRNVEHVDDFFIPQGEIPQSQTNKDWWKWAKKEIKKKSSQSPMELVDEVLIKNENSRNKTEREGNDIEYEEETYKNDGNEKACSTATKKPFLFRQLTSKHRNSIKALSTSATQKESQVLPNLEKERSSQSLVNQIEKIDLSSERIDKHQSSFQTLSWVLGWVSQYSEKMLQERDFSVTRLTENKDDLKRRKSQDQTLLVDTANAAAIATEALISKNPSNESSMPWMFDD